MSDNFLGAEFRDVGERSHLGKSVRVVAASRVFATTQDDLWDAMTTRDRLSRWFAPVEGILEPGGRYKVEGNAKGRITQCDPPHAFDLTWVIFFNTSWVQVRLQPEAAGTRLTLEHLMRKGFASERHWAKYGPGATGVGWDIGFLSLGQHLDAPDVAKDPKSQEAWTTTDEGKAFMRDCAHGWGVAHAEAGEPRADAAAAAERTASFYAGD